MQFLKESKSESFLRQAEMIHDEYYDEYFIKIKKLQKLANDSFTKIGGGSFRTVYNFDDEHVLKMIKIPKYSYMNKDEATPGIQTKYSNLLPKTLYHDPDYYWIVMEKVLKFDSSHTKVLFPHFCNLLDSFALGTKKRYMPSYYQTLLSNLLTYLKYEEKSAGTDKARSAFFTFLASLYGDKDADEATEQATLQNINSVKWLIKNIVEKEPIIRQIANMAAEFDIDTTDLYAKNLGIAIVDGEPTLKILDISIFETSGISEEDRSFEREFAGTSEITDLLEDAKTRWKEKGVLLQEYEQNFGILQYFIMPNQNKMMRFQSIYDRNEEFIIKQLSRLLSIKDERFPYTMRVELDTFENGMLNFRVTAIPKNLDSLESSQEIKKMLTLYEKLYIVHKERWILMLESYVSNAINVSSRYDN